LLSFAKITGGTGKHLETEYSEYLMTIMAAIFNYAAPCWSERLRNLPEGPPC
jgi:hypothetical protein